MHLRSTLVAAIAAVAVVAPGAPALAHEEINPKTVTVGQPAYLSLTVANEKEVNLVKIKLDAPAGVEFGTLLEGKDGWATTRSSGRMTWDGTVKAERFETFRYEIEGPDQPGTLAYKVTLSFADGTTEEHEVDITAVAPGTAGAGSASPATTGTTSTPNLTIETAPTTSPSTAAAAPANSGGDSGPAKAALAVSIVALLVAAGALAVGARRSGGGPGANGASNGGAAPGAAQDW
jgi:uncharacterized protein YcnI